MDITMTMKTFKPVTGGLALTLLLTLSSCLHNPEIPFVQPNELSKQDTQSIEKSASIIFSDLLFDSPLGDRAFSSVKFNYDRKNTHLVALVGVMKRLIKKDATIFCVADSLNSQTFTIKFVINTPKQKQSIKVLLIHNQSKKSVYIKGYQLKLK